MAMALSLGVLGDLMWMRLPEARPHLAAVLANEIDVALGEGRELRQPLLPDLVPNALWFPVLKPTLDRYPDDRDRLAEQLQVVYEAYQDEGQLRAAVRANLADYVLEWLQDPRYREIVAEVHPELSALVAREVYSG
jgi:hypothetical protein